MSKIQCNLSFPILKGDYIARKQSEEFQECLHNNTVVSVEGISGSGKTYLVASCDVLLKYEEKLWVDIEGEADLEEFLIEVECFIDSSDDFADLVDEEKCIELLSELNRRRVVLIIDNFNNNYESFHPLLKHAYNVLKSPAKIVLISNEIVDKLKELPHVGHITLDNGFTKVELKNYFREKNIEVSRSVLEEFHKRTDGLPIAAFLFYMLVTQYGRTQDSLLKGRLSGYKLIRNWIRTCEKSIEKDESRLLQMLCICNGAFNDNIVRMSLRFLSCQEEALLSLQNKHLISNQGDSGLFSVHSLLKKCIIDDMPIDIIKEYNLAYAKFYLNNITDTNNKNINRYILNRMIKACRHYQNAQDYSNANKLINAIYRPAKKHGFYSSLINICSNQVSNDPNCDVWNLYHLAHCYCITGNFKNCRSVIKEFNSMAVTDINLRVSFARVNAEMFRILGKPARGLKILKSILEEAGRDGNTSRPIYNNAQTTLIGLYYENRMLDEALELSNRIANNARNFLTGAIISTYLGIIRESLGQDNEARRLLEIAHKLFIDENDRRGQYWSLSYIALLDLKEGSYENAIKNLKDVFRFKSNIGECSHEYSRLLSRMIDYCTVNDIKDGITAESNRVDSMMGKTI